METLGVFECYELANHCSIIWSQLNPFRTDIFFLVFKSLPTKLSPHLSHSAVLEHGLRYEYVPVSWHRESRGGPGCVLRGAVQS